MTDQQIEKLLTVQTAQLAMLQGIYSCLQVLAMSKAGKMGTFNFNDLQKIIEATAASIKHP